MIEPIHNIDNNNDKEDEKDNFLSLNNNKPLIPKEQIEIKKNSKSTQIQIPTRTPIIGEQKK